ncbi:LysR family transcriptional regulator [Synechococcus sp. BMK-MC-1]|uniref:helix-turn-helix domain-containing protein n=1 Tax=Synechococcus sp. BMK-MC-1 TaxID=1442551 RepID=UPI001645AA6B|nr:LysR family transcriptional regulator [Synechococcus sp. BMK-MC-1]QNI68435.1 bacterial regulatory lysR family protein [Synechococcus sp. BMK-MC-1]
MGRDAEQVQYRIPGALLDLVLVDLLELTGSTTSAGKLLNLSQSTVSRRYSALARELGLERCRHRPLGSRFGDASWLQDLRRGVNGHRHSCGVLRVSGAPALAPVVATQHWAQWIPVTAMRPGDDPVELIRMELLDGWVCHADDRQLEQMQHHNDMQISPIPGLPIRLLHDKRLRPLAANLN